MTTRIWKLVVEAISRQLASHAKSDEQINSIKSFLKSGLGKTDEEIETLEKKKEYVWFMEVSDCKS